jgi:hypothetical protein
MAGQGEVAHIYDPINLGHRDQEMIVENQTESKTPSQQNKVGVVGVHLSP